MIVRRVLKWIDEQTELVSLIREFMEEPLAKGVGWPHVFGSAALFFFILQLVTGILLAVYYVPSPGAAHQSTSFINSTVPLGSLVRSLHHWGASAMLLLVGLHMLQAFFWGAYKRPRQIIWVIGVLLLLVTFGLSFTGYLLPWDQKAYWATVVGTRIAGAIPVVGETITTLIRGGPNVGALTLTRFFCLHVFIFPALLLGLMGFHVAQVRMKGITAPWRRVGEEDIVPKTGLFYPDQVFKDLVVAVLLLGVLFVIAFWHPAPLETIANPTSTGYKPRPEWYFLPNFQLLTYIPTAWGQWGEFFGALIVPALVVLALLLLPYLDFNPERAPHRRPLVSFACLAILGGMTYLGVSGLKTAPKPVKLTSEQARGEKIFLDLRCQSCHGINGGGGMEGVDLVEGGPRNPKATAEKLHLPTNSNPRSIMPPVPDDLSEEDFTALVAFVSAIDDRFQMPMAAPVGPTKPTSHFEQNWFQNHKYEVRKDPTVCAQCHQPSFCQSCHRNRRPDSHLNHWLKFHSGTARERPEYCEVCHEQKSCDSCHQKLLHTQDWMQKHAQPAKSEGQLCQECHQADACTTCHGGAKPESHQRHNWVHYHRGYHKADCLICHTDLFCETCHKGAKPISHDKTWPARHGTVAKTSPKECLTCHQASFCDDCHGGISMPHATDWAIKHKAQASFAPGSVCYRCHTYQKVCSQCHGETPPEGS